MTTVKLTDKIGFLQKVNSFTVAQLKKFARGFLECSQNRELIDESTFFFKTFTIDGRAGYKPPQYRDLVRPLVIDEFTFFFKTFTIDGRAGYKPPQYLDLVRPLVIDMIKNKENCVNVKIVLTCEVKKNSIGATLNGIGATLNNIPSVAHLLSNSITNFQEYDDIEQKILKSLENLQNDGWIFNRVLQLDIHMDIDFPIIQKSELFSLDTMVTFYYKTTNAFLLENDHIECVVADYYIKKQAKMRTEVDDEVKLMKKQLVISML